MPVVILLASAGAVACGSVPVDRVEPTPTPCPAAAVAIRAGEEGPKTIVSCQEMKWADATAALGEDAGPGWPSDRKVWLVRVHGNYAPISMPANVTLPPFDHYFAIVDASTFELIGPGTGPPGSEW